MYAQIDADAEKVLSPKQWTRLRQIRMQHDGPYALLRNDVITKLNINEMQIADLREILESSREAFIASGMVRMPRTAEGIESNKEYQEKLTKALDSTKHVEEAMLRKISRVLTRRQLATFDLMRGEPFSLSHLLDGKPTALRPKDDQAKPAAKVKPAAPKADAKRSLRESRGGTKAENQGP